VFRGKKVTNPARELEALLMTGTGCKICSHGEGEKMVLPSRCVVIGQASARLQSGCGWA